MPNPTGTINASEDHTAKRVVGLPTPTASDEAATKGYADSIAAGGVNSFGTIAVSGQSDVVADAAADTLTLVAGTNVTLTTNATTDTVTIAASGAGGGNVNNSGTPTSGQLAQWTDATHIAGIGSIALSQMPQGSNGQLIVATTGSAPSYKTITGDLTVGLTGAAAIPNDTIHSYQILNGAVQYAKIQNVSANSKLLGSGATGVGAPPSEITLGTNLSMSGTTLNASGGSGTVTTTGSPATGNLTKFSGATSIVNGDLSGEVTTSGTLATTIANSAVTYAKIQNVSASPRLLGRGTAAAGVMEEITLGGNLTMTGTTLDTTAGSAGVSDAAYDSSWNGVTGTAPSKNAVYDKIQTLGGGSGTTVQVSGSDFTTTSLTLVDVTGLTFAASTNSLYYVEAHLALNSSGGNGTKVAVTYSAAGATGSYNLQSHSTALSSTSTSGNALGVASATVNQITNTPGGVHIWAMVKTGANAGNITIQAEAVSSGTTTIYIGSRMTVQ